MRRQTPASRCCWCARCWRHGPRDDAHKPPRPQAPDPGFLEFLGGVDGLADINPDYLAQGKVARPPPARAGAAVSRRPRPRPPPPASAAGVKNNE